MIRIPSEQELLESFRPIDRAEIELPRDLAFPLVIRDYFSWTEPSGYRVYLVFSETGRPPLGIVFRRDQSAGGDASRMCEWCHSVRSGNAIGLLTATAAANRRVGVNLCRDLSCRAKAEAEPGADDVPTGFDRRTRVKKVVERMSLFARRNLF